jgi:predicted metal-dependent hydrolase
VVECIERNKIVLMESLMKNKDLVEHFSVEQGGRIIPVILTRKQVKNVNFRIMRDQQVAVSAPGHVPLQAIKDLIDKKASWIFGHFDNYARQQKNTTIRCYENGEKLKYLGQSYTLQVQPAVKREEVLADNEKIYLLVRADRNREYREKLIASWYREKAAYIFNKSLEKTYPLLTGQRITKPSLAIRKMKTRWGSCTRSKNKVTLSLELVKAPMTCIDYVVLHELVHFIHPHHGKAFYGCLAALMPDWKERRKKLLETISSDDNCP